jgi:adenine phosphoribosyltransferase
MKTDFELKIIKDYPKPGVNFIDINPILHHPEQFAAVINDLCDKITGRLSAEDLKSVAIIAPEARGFIFAAPVAYKLGLPLLLIRKEGKIPNNPYPFRITNEYTSYNMEVDGELLEKFNRYIYLDDILATGQTLASVRNALQEKGKEITLSLHVTDVADLKGMRDGNATLKNLPIETVF